VFKSLLPFACNKYVQHSVDTGHVVCVQMIGWKCQQAGPPPGPTVALPRAHRAGANRDAALAQVDVNNGVAATREVRAPELAATVGTMRRCNNAQITQTVFECCPFLFLEMQKRKNATQLH
jgi:hypothetical protein